MPIKDAYPLEDLANLASAYGIPSAVVDGQDMVAVAEAVMVAVERARDGKGPSFIECKTVRTGPHGSYLGTTREDKVHGKPRDPKMIEEMKKRDPVVLLRGRLLEQGFSRKEMWSESIRKSRRKWRRQSVLLTKAPFLMTHPY